MPIEGVPLPATLIVTQVVFGSPLRHKKEFRGSEVNELVKASIGEANYHRTLMRLVDLKWLTYRYQPDKTTGGHPSNYVYKRTAKGKAAYSNLKDELAQYGIELD